MPYMNEVLLSLHKRYHQPDESEENGEYPKTHDNFRFFPPFHLKPEMNRSDRK